jgi:glutamate-1-semialdehyde 2,1-aminomutase
MDRLMPGSGCQHYGTYNGHPVAVAAGLAAVTAYREPGFYDHSNAVAEGLYNGRNALFERHGVAARAQGLGARFGIYVGVLGALRNYRDAVRHHRDQVLRFVAATIGHGV